MSQDIAHILDGWDFDPHELNVRIVSGQDGSRKIQMRIDLGLLQMEIDGRPDGKRPHGLESLFCYYQQQAKEYGEGYRLSTEATEELFRERWQYYQRYLCLFHLGYYDLVVRDTERNIALFEFVRKHSRRRRDQWRFDQYCPYALMMNTRARAEMSLQANNRKGAIEDIDRGCKRIEAFLQIYDRKVDENGGFELEFLHRWREELLAAEGDDAQGSIEPEMSGSSSAVSALRTQLSEAVAVEDYEHAAILRDKIRRLEQANQGGVQ